MPKTIGRGLLLGLAAALVVHFAAVEAHLDPQKTSSKIFDCR